MFDKMSLQRLWAILLIAAASGIMQTFAQSNSNGAEFKSVAVKRAPSGFTGMRGKKLYSELAPEYSAYARQMERDKKTALTAYGSNAPHLNQILRNLNDEQLREILLKDLLYRYAVFDSGEYPDGNELAQIKRAPHGFTGMRGKRLSASAEYDNLLEDIQDELDAGIAKRAPAANAFFGVRGKRGLHAMRFKRFARTAYEQSGKKQRFYDFSNKFVAVRGKKDLESVDNFGPARNNDVWNALDYLASESGKRAPSGFVGMRGKRLEAV